MANSSHRVVESETGKLVDVGTVTNGVQDFERQRIAIGSDDTYAALAAVIKRAATDAEYALAVRPVLPAMSFGAFGGQRTFHEQIVASASFAYGINTNITTSTVNTTGTVTQASGSVLVSTGTGAAGSAKLETKRRAHYLPGRGVIARLAGAFTAGAASSQQEIGIGDDTDGFFFGFNGTAFGICRRRGGSDTWTAQTAWNGDPMDGSGPSGVTLDPTKGNVYAIVFQWLGYGAIKFFVEDPSTGGFVLAHTIRYAGTATTPSVLNPTFPLHLKAINTGNTSDLVLRFSSLSAALEGEGRVVGLRNSTDNRKTGIGSTATNVLSIRNNSTYQGIANRTQMRMDYLSISAGSNFDAVVRLVLNPTVGGSPSFTNLDATNSIAAYDTAGTTVSGGRQLAAWVMDGNQSATHDLTGLDIVIQPGDVLVFSAASVSGTADVRVAPSWVEEF